MLSEIKSAWEALDYLNRATNLTEEQRIQIISLQRTVLDMQRQGGELLEKNRELKEEVRQLKDASELEKKIERHEGGYITFKDDEKQLKHCPNCRDNLSRPQQLIPYGGYYKCMTCKAMII